jgi:hypothetical protein
MLRTAELQTVANVKSGSGTTTRQITERVTIIGEFLPLSYQLGLNRYGIVLERGFVLIVSNSMAQPKPDHQVSIDANTYSIAKIDRTDTYDFILVLEGNTP